MLDVSVVIPAYNRAATLGRAIESALGQTLAPREVIVVDDGSADGTAEVAESYSARDPRVRTIRQANGGAGAARNTGIARATGAWIALLDSDDAWASDKLGHAAAVVAATPEIDLVHSNVAFIDPDGSTHSWDRRTQEEMTDPLLLMGTFFMRTSAVLVKRTLLDGVGSGFPTDRATGEDFELFWRLIAASRGIGYVPTRDVAVHITSDGLTRVNDEWKLIRDNISTMSDVLRWLEARRFDPRLAALLRGYRYWELRKLIAIRLEARAIRALVRDLRYGAAQMSGTATLRAFASAGWSHWRQPQ